MGKKSGPKPPDYTKAAEAQGAASKEVTNMQTWANRADQTNPWGSTSWNARPVTDPATGQSVTKWTESTTLDPELQHALDSQIALQGGRSDLANSMFPRAQQEFGQPMNWGNAVGWANAPHTGQLNATTGAFGFGPRQQRIDTSRQGVPQLQTGLDFGGAQGVDDAATTRARAEDAIYGSAASRLDPQWDQRRQSLETDLANRGISANSDAYSRAVGDFDRSRNDAYAQAQMNAITGGGAEAQRDYAMDLGLRQQQVGEIEHQGQFANTALGNMFGFGDQARGQQLGAQQQAFNQGLAGNQFDLARQQQAFGQQQAAGSQNFSQQLQAGQFQNQMRQNQLAEEMQRRGFSLNEINAIISGQQVGMPQFQGYSQAGAAQAPDYLGAANLKYQADVNSQNARNDFMGGLLNAGTSIAGSYFGFSDRRLKRDVRRIGTHPRGFGFYRYRYVGERATRVGVIAQEVRRFAPELVRSVRGVLQVDYARL